ncbi:acyl carrier protein phosphodiesterase [mine drainage metagenome]|uniref:Acyl carrier protein phosphodiesterase n=1 Tax=mine drainage metagenome TaxID=410659 RepID=A0A1J5SIT8_9ZZZZ
MNYLAHAYLSFDQEEILVGNMISDFVKGKKKFNYSAGIQKGIALHRAIDVFTDTHKITHEAKQYLKPAVGLYAGAFMDILYDHFLANDKNEFPDDASLFSFTKNTYSLLEKNAAAFPERFQMMFPHMKQHDWLYNYQFNFGMEKSFGGLVRRAKYLSDSSNAFQIFEKEYDHFKNFYEIFFPELKNFARQQLQQMLAE